MTRFRDRREAGQILGELLLRRRLGGPGSLVLGLPRGGVPVAHEVARTLGAPLDVLVVRKLGVPGHEELAMGALASGGALVVNEDVVRALGLGAETLEAVALRERAELRRREALFRGNRPSRTFAGAGLIVVDDGLATGSTMRAAVRALRGQGAARITVAVPVGAREALALLEREADDVACVMAPEDFFAVGAWYEDFTQTTDQEVRELLEAGLAQGDRTHPQV